MVPWSVRRNGLVSPVLGWRGLSLHCPCHLGKKICGPSKATCFTLWPDEIRQFPELFHLLWTSKVMSDKSFKIELKTPLTATLLHKAPCLSKLSIKKIGIAVMAWLETMAMLRQWGHPKALVKQARYCSRCTKLHRNCKLHE